MKTLVLAGSLVLAAAASVHALPSPVSQPKPGTHSSDASIATRIDALAAQTGRLPSDRRAQVAVQLTRLGAAAEQELLSRLDHDSPAMAALRAHDSRAASAFDAALLHAIGELRTVRALPALSRAFEQASDPRLQRAAGDGLGKLCGLGGDAVLARHATTGDARAHAAYASLGLCRTKPTAELLAARLATAPESEAAAIAQGLGFLGSTWAWDALGPSRVGEGRAVRALCSTALVAAHARFTGSARVAIVKAMKMVDPNGARKLAK